MRTRKGGVVSKEDQSEPLKDQIDRLLKESKFEFLQRGTFGFVFKVTYMGEKSGFINFETKRPEKVFVMKVQAMDFEMSLESDHSGLPPNSKRIDWDKLRSEVDLQKNLFETALEKKIRPPCPAILDFRSITITQLDSFVKGISYKDRGKVIPQEEYDDYTAGVILMEFVPALDITTIMEKEYEKTYLPKFNEIRNKVFRLYCTALRCGVDQVDVKPPNYLFGVDGTVTMIDFGIARIVEDPRIDEYIDLAEKGDYEPLKDYLRDHNHRFDQWLLKKDHGIVVFEPLKPDILPDELVQKCRDGICEINYPEKITRTERINTRIKRLRDEQYEREAPEREAKQHANIMEIIQKIEERKKSRLNAKPSFFSYLNPFTRGGKRRRTRKLTFLSKYSL